MANSELKTYTISINPEDGAYVYAVALVDTPAHDSMYLAFNSDEYQRELFAIDDVKQQVIGAAIIPNLPIKRKPNHIVNEWHYVQFTAEDIEIMSKEFFKNKFNSDININHTDEKVDAYFFQSIIIGDKVGQGRVNGLDVPDGTWVLGAYIEDKETFKRVAENGFSVEGLFRYHNPDYNAEADFESELKKLIENLKQL